MTAMPVMLSDWLKFQKKILRSESKMDAKAEVLTWPSPINGFLGYGYLQVKFVFVRSRF
jgi:hypothetical protein